MIEIGGHEYLIRVESTNPSEILLSSEIFMANNEDAITRMSIACNYPFVYETDYMGVNVRNLKFFKNKLTKTLLVNIHVEGDMYIEILIVNPGTVVSKIIDRHIEQINDNLIYMFNKLIENHEFGIYPIEFLNEVNPRLDTSKLNYMYLLTEHIFRRVLESTYDSETVDYMCYEFNEWNLKPIPFTMNDFKNCSNDKGNLYLIIRDRKTFTKMLRKRHLFNNITGIIIEKSSSVREDIEWIRYYCKSENIVDEFITCTETVI